MKLYEGASFLDFPEKLLPLLDPDVIKKHRFFILEGGRGSGKTQTICRLFLYFAEKYSLRMIGAREIQSSIEDSVYTVFTDLIAKNDLLFDIKKSRITHMESGSAIGFKGLREQGAVNIKGMENVDLVFIDEGQSITQTTLDILIPTIRKNNAKIFIALNRFVRNDPVMSLVGREDTYHVHIDYFENKHCTRALKTEAEECKSRDEKKYKHIWLGEPLDTTVEFLFNFSKLAKLPYVESFGDMIIGQKVMGVDFASGGGDLCVASLIERTSNVHWELTQQIAWDNPDTDESVGKVINLFGQWRPDILICDAGGLGYPMFVTLSKTIPNIIGFDGAKTDKCTDPTSGNNRYQAYLDLKTWTDQEWIRITSKYTISELETIKKKYKASGKMYLMDKITQRKDGTPSQDRGDSVAMAVHGAVHYLGKVDFKERDTPIGMRAPKRVNKRKSVM